MADKPEPPKAWREKRDYPLSDRQISRALAVWREERAELLKVDPDLFEKDPQALRDTLEGETEVYELLDRLIRVALLEEAKSKATKFEIDFLTGPLEERMAAADRKVDLSKAACQRILEEIGEKRYRSPAATVGTRDVPAKLIINDSAALFKWFEKSGLKIDIYWKIEPKPRATQIELLFSGHKSEELPEGVYRTNPRTTSYIQKG